MSDQKSGLPAALESRIVHAYHALRAKNPAHDLLELAYVIGDALLSVSTSFPKRFRLEDPRSSATQRYEAYAARLEAAVQAT